MFGAGISEKYQNFLSENCLFLVVKFSIYLNRHVFVMVLWPSQHCLGYVEPFYSHFFSSNGLTVLVHIFCQ